MLKNLKRLKNGEMTRQGGRQAEKRTKVITRAAADYVRQLKNLSANDKMTEKVGLTKI